MARRSARDVVEAIEHNCFQALATFGRTPHGSVRDEAEMVRVFTEIAVPSPLCGWIFRARLPEDGVVSKIDEAVSAFAARELPVIWNTGPSTRPADLESHLLNYTSPRVPEEVVARARLMARLNQAPDCPPRR